MAPNGRFERLLGATLLMGDSDNLFGQIVCKENLYRAVYNAAKGKRYRESTAGFLFHLEKQVQLIRTALASGEYRHGKYRTFTLYDPKKREISAASFRDRVVHHALCDVIEPMLDKTLIYDTYACRKGKGTHAAIKRAQKFIFLNKYVFHGDIRKYFQSIDHVTLKTLFSARIKDPEARKIMGHIIDSSPASVMGKGLPIGNLTSQLLANLYLDPLDRFVKHELRQKYYLRYMDDFLIFSNDRERLAGIKDQCRGFVKEMLGLDLHEAKSQIFDTRKGFGFLGFRMYKAGRRLNTDNVRRFKKRIGEQSAAHKRGELTLEKMKTSVRCWAAHAKHANTYALRKTLFRSELFQENGLARQLF